jgi:hypothetical protein
MNSGTLRFESHRERKDRANAGSRRISHRASAAMPCPEHDRLRQQYEAALRHWGQVMLFLKSDLPEAQHQASQFKLNALNERNATSERMCFHKRTCLFCENKADLD